ncbi:hypothetical protein C1646_755120 [Rhizophagus diaphanus]|nr:hypothetical protein C1646_755120 [Rhizophagus diaphanus] [Rhizophagus sp. MUCL 43196]
MGGVPSNMLKHLKEECSNISEELHNPEVIKLLKMKRSSYNFSSRKWISTEILDQVHKEVDCEIQKFVAEAKFLTLSESGWTNISKQNMVKFIITNEKWQSQI